MLDSLFDKGDDGSCIAPPFKGRAHHMKTEVIEDSGQINTSEVSGEIASLLSGEFAGGVSETRKRELTEALLWIRS